jgi:hypothetical protein
MQLLPVLSGLGVGAAAIKDEIIRLFELPVTFSEPAPAAPTSTEAPPATPEAAVSTVIGGA